MIATQLLIPVAFEHRVVGVEAGPEPGRELDAAERSVRHFNADWPTRRVVIGGGGDAVGFRHSQPKLGLKAGSYCHTGLPLLLSTVRPFTIQRALPVSGSGSACTFFIKAVPLPSAHSSAICNGFACAASAATWLAYLSRTMPHAPGMCRPHCRLAARHPTFRRSGRRSGWMHFPARLRPCRDRIATRCRNRQLRSMAGWQAQSRSHRDCPPAS